MTDEQFIAELQTFLGVVPTFTLSGKLNRGKILALPCFSDLPPDKLELLKQEDNGRI